MGANSSVSTLTGDTKGDGFCIGVSLEDAQDRRASFTDPMVGTVENLSFLLSSHSSSPSVLVLLTAPSLVLSKISSCVRFEHRCCNSLSQKLQIRAGIFIVGIECKPVRAVDDLSFKGLLIAFGTREGPGRRVLTQPSATKEIDETNSMRPHESVPHAPNLSRPRRFLRHI